MNLLLSMAEDVSECIDMVVSGDDGDELHEDSAVSMLQLQLQPDSVCRVCGDSATGMYFGALVCVPCKVSITIIHCVSESVSVLVCVPEFKFMF